MIIEPLRHQSIPQLISLMQLGVPFLRARAYTDYWVYATHFSSTSPTALEEGRLAGAILAFRSQDQPADLYIQDVMTHPDFRRQGVTRKLMDHTRTRAQALNCDRMYLTSAPGNIRAHHTWTALGFTNIEGDHTVDGVSLTTDFKGPGNTRAVYELKLS